MGVVSFFIMGFCAILLSYSFAYAQFEINEEDDFFEHYTRPTFGISHGNNEKIVDMTLDLPKFGVKINSILVLIFLVQVNYSPLLFYKFFFHGKK